MCDSLDAAEGCPASPCLQNMAHSLDFHFQSSCQPLNSSCTASFRSCRILPCASCNSQSKRRQFAEGFCSLHSRSSRCKQRNETKSYLQRRHRFVVASAVCFFLVCARTALQPQMDPMFRRRRLKWTGAQLVRIAFIDCHAGLGPPCGPKTRKVIATASVPADVDVLANCLGARPQPFERKSKGTNFVVGQLDACNAEDWMLRILSNARNAEDVAGCNFVCSTFKHLVASNGADDAGP